MPEGIGNTSQQAIRGRLQALQERFSQAEIARRTGESPANVNRYLKSNRIPATFVASCVEHLGASPAWLLTGQGAPFLDDVAEGTGRMAADLLDVVKALNVVEHMRIGSLGGKRHLRTLRELGDAMTRYEHLRQRLNRHSLPILRPVLDDLRAALDRSNLGLARDLASTAQQLERFTDDAALSAELILQCARLALFDGDAVQAIELTRRSILLSLHHGANMDAKTLDTTIAAAYALRQWGRYREATRLARGALALADPNVRRTPGADMLRVLLADIRAQWGGLKRGLRVLAGIIGRSENTEAQTRAETSMSWMLMLSGAFHARAAADYGQPSQEKAGRILSVATFSRSPQDIAEALKFWDDQFGALGDFWPRHNAVLLQRVLAGDRRGLAEEVTRFVESRPGSSNFPMDWGGIMGAELFHLLGKPALARQAHQRATRQVADLPGWFSMGFLWRARHHRNALEYGNEPERKRARAFIERNIRRGYRCLA